MSENKLSGKSLRRKRVRANHERLHKAYLTFLEEHFGVLSYGQWLHSQMRNRVLGMKA